MREILFRGKRLDNGEWVEGFLVKRPSAIHIGDYSPWYIEVPPKDPDDKHGSFSVDPATVGQYTGLQDKNGKRIFEDDILRWVGPDGESGKVYVKYAGGVFALHGIECPHADPDLFADFEVGCQTLEVIGNIHDNPELTKNTTP